MGFLGKLFGQKNTEMEKIETTIDLLPSIIEKNFEAKRESLEMDVAKEMSEIKYLHEKAIKLTNDLKSKELEEKENMRFNKAAKTSKNQLEKQLEKLLEKSNPIKIGNNLEEVRAYVGESYSLLVNEVNSFRKNIVYTSAYLKDEMKELGEVVQGLLDKLFSLQKKFDGEKELFQYKKVIDRIEEIKERKTKKEEYKKNIEKEKKLIEEIEKRLTRSNTKILELDKGSEIEELKKLEEEKSSLLNEKQQLRVEITSMISTIDRPLQRFKALVDSGRWKIDKEQEELLKQFITNPLLALKKDVNGKQFKEILKEIVKAIDDEKIDLKEREKEKRLGALQELINFDFFEKIFWKLNDMQKKLLEIEKQISSNEGQKRLSAEEGNRSELEKEINNHKEIINDLEKEINRLEEKNKSEMEYIFKFGERALNKQIILK